ncbi:MAG: hypothetical protein AB7Q97_11780 [Gammaproteobacteria bacterium]
MKPALRTLGLLFTLAAAGSTHAALVTVDTGPLTISYEESDLINVGTPSFGATHVVFSPGLYIEAPPDQSYYYDSAYFAVRLDVRANPGYRLLGASLAADGGSYVGDDAIVGIDDAFSLVYYGASWFSGALSGSGPWSTSGNAQIAFPYVGFSGSAWVTTENHYNYEGIVGYEQEARYDYVYTEVIVGYAPIYDGEGNQIGEEPIYEGQYEEVFVGYFDVPIYGTIYQTSGGSIRLDSIVLDLQVEAAPVPLPPAALLLASGLGMLVRRRARRG